jgi:hypothetical protein
MKLHQANVLLKTSIPTSTVIKEWADVVKAKGAQKMPILSSDATELCTILTFDSYYLCNTGRALLRSMSVPFVASVTKERFGRLVDKVKDDVERPGQFSVIHRSETQESFVYMWDTTKAVGKKFAITNAFKMLNEKHPDGSVPVYDHYKAMFSKCDRFNRLLHDRKWPHNHCGRNCRGDEGHHHNFGLSCILQNTFNAYLEINGNDSLPYEFERYCLELANDIYIYVSTK